MEKQNRKLALCLFFIWQSLIVCGQNILVRVPFQVSEQQKQALALLSKCDTKRKSLFWPNIEPELFFENIRRNILFPEKIHQGRKTNFCGYAAVTYILMKHQPENYTRLVLSLYYTGEAHGCRKVIKPSRHVRQAGGALQNKGDLSTLHADQMWFLALADCFRGYLNVMDLQFHLGDENTFWAATNYGKFNRMLRQLGGFELRAIGSDLHRPIKKNLSQYISRELDMGIVLLYVNSKYLHPTNFPLVKLWAPTHFIVLSEMKDLEDRVEIEFWDYGVITRQVISKKLLKKFVFGITRLSSHTNAEIANTIP